MMKNLTKDKSKIIENYFDEILPNVGCELNYNKDYELLLAVMLSAQTSDIAVNNVTKVLFSKFDSLEKIHQAKLEEIESIIKPIGLYKNKAKNIKLIVDKLINDFNGILPSKKEDLETFPGVGNKTACVVRAEIFKINEFPVDTHVLRISKRLNIANSKDKPIDAERKLKKFFDEKSWIKLHHQFIHFGRQICYAKSPKCDCCKLTKFCNYFLDSNNKSKASK